MSTPEFVNFTKRAARAGLAESDHAAAFARWESLSRSGYHRPLGEHLEIEKRRTFKSERSYAPPVFFDNRRRRVAEFWVEM